MKSIDHLQIHCVLANTIWELASNCLGFRRTVVRSVIMLWTRRAVLGLKKKIHTANSSGMYYLDGEE